MSGYTCAVAGAKGGVGKTTASVNIAATLAADDHEVALVDADLKMPDVGQTLGLDVATGIQSVLSGKANLDEALLDAAGGITLVPGETALEAYADADSSKIGAVSDALAEQFDVVIVDTAPGLAHETVVPLGRTDGVILVSTAAPAAITDTQKTAQMVERVDGTVLGGLVTQVKTPQDCQSADEALDVPLLGFVPADLDATRKEPLVLNSPGSPAAEAYHAITQSLAEIFVDGKNPDSLDPVIEEIWFEGDGDEIQEEGGSFDMLG